MPDKKPTYAQQLMGRELPGNWKVQSMIERMDDQSGGYFSVSYIVKKGNQKAFLKALDYQKTIEEASDAAIALEILTASYNFEREVLDRCKHLSRIITVLDWGQIKIDEDKPLSVVQYLILELSDEGDIRSYVKFEQKFDEALCLRILHSVTAALRQLHLEKIAHQDLKASNILFFKDGHYKLTDLGRAYDHENQAPHDFLDCAGDKTYAPPELLYGYIDSDDSDDSDWNKRRLGCDMYLLGSLVASFYLGGASMTHLILNCLEDEYHPRKYKGDYMGVIAYVQKCFAQIIRDIQSRPSDHSEEIGNIVKQMCNPNPEKRGHPIEIRRKYKSSGQYNQYNLERYISAFDKLLKKTENSLSKMGNK